MTRPAATNLAKFLTSLILLCPVLVLMHSLSPANQRALMAQEATASQESNDPPLAIEVDDAAPTDGGVNSANEEIGSAEQPSVIDSLIPYQRVFLPEDEIQLFTEEREEYTPVEISELSKWQVTAPPGVVDPIDWRTRIASPPELESAIYSARLVGADLVSTKSLIQSSRGSIRSELLRLSPWSLSITSNAAMTRELTSRSSRPDLLDTATSKLPASDWGFDPTGTPVLNLQSPSAIQSVEPKNFEFGWVLHGEQVERTRLHFQAQLPRCKNSCLLLTLPPSMRIENSSVPVIRIDTPDPLERRLASIPSLVRPSFERIHSDAVDQSYWVLELSGVDSLEFSIQSSPAVTRSRGDAANLDKAFEFLVLNQANQYNIEGGFVHSKANLELQWNSNKKMRPLRFSLSENSKVKRMTAAGTELAWEYDSGYVTIATDQIDTLAQSSAGPIFLQIETLAPLDGWKGVHPVVEPTIPPSSGIPPPVVETIGEASGIDSQTLAPPASPPAETHGLKETAGETESTRIELPSLMLDRSFILKGESVLIVGNKYRVTHMLLRDGVYDANQAQSELTFQWRDRPCEIQLNIAAAQVVKSGYSVTKVSSPSPVTGLDGRLNVAVRLIPQEPVKNDLLVELAPGWEVMNSVGIDHRVVSSPNTDRDQVLLLPQGIASTETFFDLNLKPKNEQSIQQWVIPANGLVKVPGTHLHQLFVAESLPSRFMLEGILSQTAMPAETLASSVRSFLSTTDRSSVWEMKSEDILIRPRESLGKSTIHLRTQISEVSSGVIRVQHFFTHDVQRQAERLTFSLPRGQNPWRAVVNSRSIASSTIPNSKGVGATTSPSNQDTKLSKSTNLIRNLSEIDSTEEFSVDLLDRTASDTWGVETYWNWDSAQAELPLPRFSDRTRVVHTVRTAFPLSVEEALNEDAPASIAWDFDESGDLFWNRGAYGSALMIVSSSDSGGQLAVKQSPTATVSLAVDTSMNSAAYVQLTLAGPTNNSQVVSVSDGWSVDVDSIEIASTSSSTWLEPGPLDSSFVLATQSKNEPRDDYESVVTVAFIARERGNDRSVSETATHWKQTVAFPMISVDDVNVESAKSLWVSQNASWRTLGDRDRGGAIEWSKDGGLRWWRYFWRIMLDSPSALSSGSFSKTEIPARLAAAFPQNLWRVDAEFSKGSDTNTVPLMNIRLLRALGISAFLVMLVVTISMRWIGRATRTWQFLLLSVVLSVPLLLGAPWEFFICCALAGATLGMSLCGIVSALSYVPDSPKRRKEDPPNWEDSQFQLGDKRLEGNSNAAVKSTAVILFVWLTLSADVAYAQDAETAMPPFTVIIPTDDSGKAISEKAYIPTKLHEALSGKPASSFLIYSARYNWRINHRNRPNSIPDQLVATYDVWTDGRNPTVSFPIGRTQAALTQFLVDDAEVSLPRLPIQGESIDWSPPGPGRYSIRMVLTPRLAEQSETPELIGARNERWATQTYRINLLPAANAVLEIEAVDPTVQIDVDSRGGTANPSPGRYVVSLGNETVLNLSTKMPSNNATATTGSSSLPSTPSLDMEFLFLGTHVRAKSILRIPHGSTWKKNFTLEVDDAWLPIGTRWGGVNLVETKNASAISKKQYVFELDDDIAFETPLEIELMWALRDPSTTTLNVLFLECVDSRLLHGTLRYAGQAVSDWTVDHVRYWETAFNDRERLDWREVSTAANPIVTSLRFPSNGGYGMLKRKSRVDSIRARVKARWSILEDSQLLLVNIDTNGYTNADIIDLTLPHGFVVTGARHRFGDFVVFQDTRPSSLNTQENVVQLVTDRQLLDTHEIELRAEKQGISGNLDFPTIESTTLPIVESTVDLTASENWLVQLHSVDGTSRVYNGRGQQSPVAMLSRGDVLQIRRRQPMNWQSVRWELAASPTEPDRVELVLKGKAHLLPGAISKFIVEYPTSVFGNYRCTKPAAQLNSPITDMTWVQIDLGSPVTSESEEEWSLSLPFLSKNLAVISDGVARLRIVDQETFQISAEAFENALASFISVQATHGPFGGGEANVRSKQASFSYLDSSPSATDESPSEIVFWMHPSEAKQGFRLENDLEIRSVKANGKSIGWSLNENQISLRLPPLPVDLPSEFVFQIIAKNVDTPAATKTIEPNHATIAFTAAGDGVLETLDALSAVLQEATVELPDSMESQSFGADWLLNTHRSIVEFCNRNRTGSTNTAISAIRETMLLQEAIWPSLEWDSVPIFESSSPKIAVEDRAATPAARFNGLLYTIATLASLMAIPLASYRWAYKPEWLLLAMAVPLWIITGAWLVPSILGAVAAIMFLDSLWLRRSHQTKFRNR